MDIKEAARNTAISKTNDFGSGCSADGNVLVDSRIYDVFLAQLVAEGGYVVDAAEKERLRTAYCLLTVSAVQRSFSGSLSSGNSISA